MIENGVAPIVRDPQEELPQVLHPLLRDRDVKHIEIRNTPVRHVQFVAKDGTVQ